MENDMIPESAPAAAPVATEEKERAYRFILNAETQKRFWLDEKNTRGVCRKFALFLGALYVLWLAYWFLGSFLLTPAPMAWELWKLMAVIAPAFLLKEATLTAIGFLLFIAALTLHERYRKTGILVDAQGIHFRGFVFCGIRGYYAWDEFAQIRRAVFRKQDVLVFIDRYGKSFRIPFGENIKRGFWARCWRPRAPFLVGDGHALSLPEAIEHFYALPVTLLAAAEQKRVPALRPGQLVGNIDFNLTGRVDFLLALALAFVLLGVLFLASSQLVLLESWKSPLALLYGLTIGFGFLFAWRFLKALRQESWETAWIAALLFAAAVGFLTAALAPRLPLWLGEERRETFALQEANRRYPEQQTWHAAQDKGSLLPRSFRYKLPKEHPRPEPGAKREFTLRCFLGLCAMSQGELKPLWEQESEDRDRGSGNRKSGEGAFPSEATGNPPADATRKE